MKKARLLAGYRTLPFSGGYGSLDAGGALWQADEATPTRLGEPTVTVRLGRRDGDHIVPLYGRGKEGWHESSLPVRLTVVPGPSAEEPQGADAKEKKADKARETERHAAARRSMPDAGRYSTLLVLSETDEPGTWAATPTGKGAGPLRYSAHAGLYRATKRKGS